MNSSLINAMNSMSAFQNKIDTIADNTANVDTVGYKRKVASFADLLNSTTTQPEDFLKDGRLTPLGFTQGWGSRIASIFTDFEQGTLQATNNLTDLAIEGRALFEVQVDNEGTIAYTRDGSFQVSINGEGQAILTTSQGFPVLGTVDGTAGNIVIPDGYNLQIGQDGTVLASNGDETLNLGRINLVSPVRPDMLTQVANNLFAVADGLNREDVVQRVFAGDNNNGISIRQGYLEGSNVDLTTELTDLVRAQRAYQLAARALSSSDTLMQISNNLRS